MAAPRHFSNSIVDISMSISKRWAVGTLGDPYEEGGVQLCLEYFLPFGPLAPCVLSPCTGCTSKQKSRAVVDVQADRFG